MSESVTATQSTLIVNTQVVVYPKVGKATARFTCPLISPTASQLSQLAAVMRPSRLPRLPPSLIHRYNKRILGTAETDYGHTDHVEVAGRVLHLLRKFDPKGAVVDVCAGIGALTTPIALRFDNVLALELNKYFVDCYGSYLKTDSRLRQVVTLRAQDVSNVYAAVDAARDWMKTHRVGGLEAVVLNPPYQRPPLVAHSFFVACELDPKAIVAVMPLDILEETVGGYSWRCDQDFSSKKPSSGYLQVMSDCIFVSGVRKDRGWHLSELALHYRGDRTAEYGTMLFERTGQRLR